MRRRLQTRSQAGMFILITLAACSDRQDLKVCSVPADADPAARAVDLAGCPSPPAPLPPQAARGAVDILFLIDNSPSMTPKQQALAQNIPAFIRKIDASFSDYHVAIATSDVGTSKLPGHNWGGNIGSCDTFAGDDGLLQVTPCSARTAVSAEAHRACQALCPDSRFVPVDGRRFIAKRAGVTNVPPALERDPMTGSLVDVGPSKTFKCLALVGDSGCGAESQLEGSRRALDGHLDGNAGFLRPGSFLAIIYITDEDDCSVQPTRRGENDPLTLDCDPTRPDAPDCYNSDFRCLARSLECNETLLTPGVKTGCRERPANYLEPVEKYYKFFSSLRPPARLLVSGIWTLPSITRGGRVEVSRTSGVSGSPGLNRAHGAGAACVYAKDASVYGQPQLRLSKFAHLFGHRPDGSLGYHEGSICDIDSYPDALDEIAQAIISSGNPG